MGRIRVRTVSSASFHEYRALSQALKGADRQLQRDLRRRIRQEGQPALTAVRAAAQGIEMTSTPSAGGGRRSTGLRARLAAATRVSAQATGVRIAVQENRVDPEYGNTLVQGSEGLKRWRHPVFGNTEKWVGQKGSPWFYPTLRREGPAFRAAVERAMRDTMRKI